MCTRAASRQKIGERAMEALCTLPITECSTAKSPHSFRGAASAVRARAHLGGVVERSVPGRAGVMASIRTRATPSSWNPASQRRRRRVDDAVTNKGAPIVDPTMIERPFPRCVTRSQVGNGRCLCAAVSGTCRSARRWMWHDRLAAIPGVALIDEARCRRQTW